jgi:hypothetical protein
MDFVEEEDEELEPPVVIPEGAERDIAKLVDYVGKQVAIYEKNGYFNGGIERTTCSPVERSVDGGVIYQFHGTVSMVKELDFLAFTPLPDGDDVDQRLLPIYEGEPQGLLDLDTLWNYRGKRMDIFWTNHGYTFYLIGATYKDICIETYAGGNRMLAHEFVHPDYPTRRLDYPLRPLGCRGRFLGFRLCPRDK